jgi:hypothetical protein
MELAQYQYGLLAQEVLKKKNLKDAQGGANKPALEIDTSKQN